MAIDIGRRKFISALGGTVAMSSLPLPHAARAEKADRLRRIGVLMDTPESDPLGQSRISAFLQELQKLGWEEGRNLKIELRWSGGDASRIKDYTAELVTLAPDVIVANGSPVVAAMEQATRSIPIVFVVVTDPVEQGFIPSFAHPGGNLTGFSFGDFPLFGKSLQLLRQIAPGVTRVGFMFRPADNPYYDAKLKSLATEVLPTEVARTAVGSNAEIENQVAKLAAQPGSGLIVAAGVFTLTHRQVILASVAQHSVPTISCYREAVVEGGLMSYAPNTVDIFRRSASYVDRMLKGEKPADLPAQSPIKFELVVNLKTAKTLGLDVPPALLALADEVVE
jgi:putative tryptophan/tyrosine transport system substrate-binding protein